MSKPHQIPPTPPPETAIMITPQVDDLVLMSETDYTPDINEVPIPSSPPPLLAPASHPAALRNKNQTATTRQFLANLSSNPITSRSPQHEIHQPNPTRTHYTSTFLNPTGIKLSGPTVRLDLYSLSVIDLATHR